RVRCTCDTLGYSRIMLLISLLQISILSVLLAAANLKFSNGPKAIVFIHGILGNYQEGSNIQQWVSEGMRRYKEKYPHLKEKGKEWL
uniref:Uncharacterized protein n=1 Tax=Magallana gigas TaxID=29159 RepID=A0A8W8L1K2_MAGGI